MTIRSACPPYSVNNKSVCTESKKPYRSDMSQVTNSLMSEVCSIEV